MKKISIVILMAAAIIACVFHSGAFAAGSVSYTDSIANSEAVIGAKNFGGVLDGFLGSKFAGTFGASKLFSRFEQTQFYEKYAQITRAFSNTFGENFKYAKLVEFMNCDGCIYFINSDPQSLCLLMELDKNISKYEYFTKFKKDLKSEKVSDSTIYFVCADDGSDVLGFMAFKGRTYVSNDIELLRSLASGESAMPERSLKLVAPVNLAFNLDSINAKLTDNFKKKSAFALYIFPSADKTLKMFAFNTLNQPDAKMIAKADEVFARINVPVDAPALACVNDSFDNGAFLKKVAEFSSTMEVSAEYSSMLARLASAAGKGFRVIADRPADSGQFGVYMLSMAFGKFDEKEMPLLKKYLYGLEFYNSNGNLTITNAKLENTAYKNLNFEWLDNILKSVKISDSGYLYFIKPDAACDIIKPVLNGMVNMNNWRSSDTSEFAGEILNSLETLKEFELIGVASGSESLNSVIKIKMK